MRFWGFPRYVSKAEKQARATKKLEQLKKKRDVKPVIIQGSAIARTWWGKSWGRNLERYADYSNRIGRGRSYVRHGAVLDLQIGAGEIKSLVQGSRSKPYEVSVTIKKVKKVSWQQITASCSGLLDSVQELVSGKFPKQLEEVFMRNDGGGLFPSPKEISFECSCPDWASMCKHVAATLYAVGARLDEDALLFFKLRGVDVEDLVNQMVSSKAESLLEKASKKSLRIIGDADLSGLFGIELINDNTSSTGGAENKQAKKGRRKNVKNQGKVKRNGDVERKRKISKNTEKSIQLAKITAKKTQKKSYSLMRKSL